MKKLSLTLLISLGLMATFFTSCDDDDDPDPDSGTPSISSLSPTSGPEGTTVTISGSDFGDSPTVSFGSTSATVSSSTATSITTTVPSGLSAGDVDVTVTSGGETSNAVSFEVTEGETEGPTAVFITDDDLVAGETYEWTADNEYFLTGLVYVEEGAVLNIEEGTTVRFTAETGDDNTSALIISQGAQIQAVGTAENPIIFTSEADTANAGLTPLDFGQWGGLILLGRAPTEKGGATSGINIEGISSEEPRGVYGGDQSEDNSGTLQYVSIRYSGVGIAANSEIQGLTLGGVGSGTTIDHIDIYSSGDDGIEIFGGTVDISHVSVAFATDDAFDFDEGWRGNGQFLFAIQLEGGEEDFDQVGEWDGAVPDDANLYSAPNIFNATLVGPGQNSTDVFRGLLLRDAFAGKFGNSIMEDFPGVALQVEDAEGDENDSYGRLVTATADGYQLEILNNTFAVFGGATDLASLVEATEDGGYIGQTEAVVAELTDNNNVFSADAVLTGVSRTTDGGLDPRPAAATDATVTVPEGLEQVDYRGAFMPGEATWLSGWSTLSQLGYLVD